MSKTMNQLPGLKRSMKILPVLLTLLGPSLVAGEFLFHLKEGEKPVVLTQNPWKDPRTEEKRPKVHRRHSSAHSYERQLWARVVGGSPQAGGGKVPLGLMDLTVEPGMTVSLQVPDGQPVHLLQVIPVAPSEEKREKRLCALQNRPHGETAMTLSAVDVQEGGQVRSQTVTGRVDFSFTEEKILEAAPAPGPEEPGQDAEWVFIPATGDSGSPGVPLPQPEAQDQDMEWVFVPLAEDGADAPASRPEDIGIALPARPVRGATLRNRFAGLTEAEIARVRRHAQSHLAEASAKVKRSSRPRAAVGIEVLLEKEIERAREQRRMHPSVRRQALRNAYERNLQRHHLRSQAMARHHLDRIDGSLPYAIDLGPDGHQVEGAATASSPVEPEGRSIRNLKDEQRAARRQQEWDQGAEARAAAVHEPASPEAMMEALGGNLDLAAMLGF